MKFSYSFSRLINHNELEFFWNTSLTNTDNFDEYWDGRGRESVGYLVMHKDHEQRKLRNLLYFIKDKAKDKKHLKRYSYDFANSMISVELESYEIEYVYNETNVYQTVVTDPELISFIKRIVINDIPNTLFNRINL
ncbi:hypothetical protein [Ferdinandcohnia sp. Marseille-Q9671]